MKRIKLYENFINDKWTLKVNESIFDKIETLVKGKSDKGKIIEQFLIKNSIQPKGSVYMVHFLGGASPGKNELSHPFDYLHYTPGVAKITEDDVLELVDENAKKLKTPDTLSFLAVMEKDAIVKNWTFGLKQGCGVKKGEYQFDLSKEMPTLNIKESMWSMANQKWNPTKEEEIQLDEDIKEIKDEDIVSFKTPMAMITLEQWVEKLNATGWVKKDPEYFKEYIK